LIVRKKNLPILTLCLLENIYRHTVRVSTNIAAVRATYDITSVDAFLSTFDVTEGCSREISLYIHARVNVA